MCLFGTIVPFPAVHVYFFIFYRHVSFSRVQMFYESRKELNLTIVDIVHVILSIANVIHCPFLPTVRILNSAATLAWTMVSNLGHVTPSPPDLFNLARFILFFSRQGLLLVHLKVSFTLSGFLFMDTVVFFWILCQLYMEDREIDFEQDSVWGKEKGRFRIEIVKNQIGRCH